MLIAVIGIFVAAVLTVQHFKPGAGGLCKAGMNSCEGVLKSQYGAVAGIPIAILGLGMYLTFLYLGSVRGKLLKRQGQFEAQRAQAYAEGEENPAATGLRPQIHKLDQFLWVMAAAAFGISWWLQYASIYILIALCPWCLSSAILVTLLFILTSYDFHFAGKEGTGEKKMLAGITIFIAGLLILMNAPEIAARYQFIKAGNIEPPRIMPSQVNPKELIAKTRWWRGDKNATVNMIEFADYMCPTCKVVHENVKNYMKMRPEALRLGFFNFPIPMAAHRWSRQAAAAAEAAGQQGKFWEMHDYLFEHQDEMKDPTFTAEKFSQFAEEIKLDMTKFRKDFANPRMAEIVDADEALGLKNKVDSTPTSFLINGDIVVPCVGTEQLQKVMMDMNHPLWKTKK